MVDGLRRIHRFAPDLELFKSKFGHVYTSVLRLRSRRLPSKSPTHLSGFTSHLDRIHKRFLHVVEEENAGGKDGSGGRGADA